MDYVSSIRSMTEPVSMPLNESKSMPHVSSPLSNTNKQNEHISVANDMANEFLNFTFEQQNEMMLYIQKRLIEERIRQVEMLEKQLYGIQNEIERARAALNSIS